MLQQLLLLYAGYNVYETSEAVVHIVGPPGSGKSTTVKQLADLVGVDLHIISVARLNPLESEGVQMPVGEGEDMILKMLPAAMWERMKEGDIVLFDEFLRGHVDVYNALLDVFTSRRVGNHHLPPVFMIAASNSVTTYDDALKDRLLHLPVADPRKNKTERKRLTQLLVDQLGLHPSMTDSLEMSVLMDRVVLPTFNVMDKILDSKPGHIDDEPQGRSVRNLIAQVQLRLVQTKELAALIEENNSIALSEGKPQYVVLLNTRTPKQYVANARKWLDGATLTPVQQRNLQMNLQMIDLAEAGKEKVE